MLFNKVASFKYIKAPKNTNTAKYEHLGKKTGLMSFISFWYFERKIPERLGGGMWV